MKTVNTVIQPIMVYNKMCGLFFLPFERNRDSHEDACCHRDGVQRVQQVGEEDDVGLGGEAKVLSQRLQNPTQKVDIVKAGQGNEQKIERVAHV